MLNNSFKSLKRILYIFKKVVLFLCYFENDTSCRITVRLYTSAVRVVDQIGTLR